MPESHLQARGSTPGCSRDMHLVRQHGHTPGVNFPSGLDADPLRNDIGLVRGLFWHVLSMPHAQSRCRSDEEGPSSPGGKPEPPPERTCSTKEILGRIKTPILRRGWGRYLTGFIGPLYTGRQAIFLGGTMQIEIIMIGAFALLAIGRVAWETLKGREPETTEAEASEWRDAIK